MSYKREPVMSEMCSSCPFRPEGLTELAPYLTRQAITEASRICHSTGNSAVYGRTGKSPHLCRGARDVQLKAFFKMKGISAPTDEAWEAKCKEMGLP